MSANSHLSDDSDEGSYDSSMIQEKVGAIGSGSESGFGGEECKEALGLELSAFSEEEGDLNTHDNESSTDSDDDETLITVHAHSLQWWLLYGLLSVARILVIRLMTFIGEIHNRAMIRLRNMKLVDFLLILLFASNLMLLTYDGGFSLYALYGCRSPDDFADRCLYCVAMAFNYLYVILFAQ